ncbi:MAG: class I SAM-dependent methyltransferase [Betaproteobacteria bacterium]|nr:class I SAM-dependent methyltransferase [Betaproteobacteria bacterium]
MNPVKRVIGRMAVGLLLAAPIASAQEGEGDVVYVPTPQHVVEAMLEMAKVGPSDTLIDLGSGDGRVVITAAKKHGAQGLGVDLDRYLLKLANAGARKEGVGDRARFLEQNLFETDLSAATVITTYLLPEMNLKLQPKFLALRPGTRIVAHDYDFDSNWTPDARKVMDAPGKTVGEPGKSYIYLYIVPARMAGEWQSQVRHGGRVVPYRFSFDQEFQFVEGVASAGGSEGKIPEFRLAGDRLEFTTRLVVQGKALDHRFAGQVKGDRIEGTMTLEQGAAQREQPWTARLVRARAVSDGSGRPPRQYRHLKQ